MTSPIVEVPVYTDQGIGRDIQGELRYLEADDVAGMGDKQVFEARRQGDTEWRRFRAKSKHPSSFDGVIAIDLENPNE